MASLYSKVFWNKITLLENLVFIRVFNFRWQRPASRHALFHSFQPLLRFLVHVIVFCKVDCVVFKLTSWKPRHIIASLQTYWHALLKAWPKQEPYQEVASFKGTQLTTKLKTLARVDRLPPLSFMYVINLFNKL